MRGGGLEGMEVAPKHEKIMSDMGSVLSSIFHWYKVFSLEEEYGNFPQFSGGHKMVTICASLCWDTNLKNLACMF